MIFSCLKALFVGGLICAAAQILIDKTALTPARILSGCVVLGVVLGALGVYEPFAAWAGAGATVPLPGFGSLLAKGMREAVAEKGATGLRVPVPRLSAILALFPAFRYNKRKEMSTWTS